MTYPKLSMRRVSRHSAVVKDQGELVPGLDVALCYLIPTIGKSTRCAQAVMGMINAHEEGKTKSWKAKEGYRHTPTWGIIIGNVAKVDWVNTSPGADYASFIVSRSTDGLSFGDQLAHRADSVDAVADCAVLLPEVKYYNERDEMKSTYEKIVGFDNLGLSRDPNELCQFVVALSWIDNFVTLPR